MAAKLKCKHQHVEFVIHRVRLHRFTYSTCLECGKEWTVDEHVEDLAEPITADEIIEAHQLLESGKSLKDLIL